MSSSLVWEPVIDQEQNILSDKLKYALRKRYEDPVVTTFDSDDIHYLAGLLDAGITDARDIINAIGKYGQVKVEEVF
ncbi:MAG: hypothetical protein V3R67_08820 [Thermodesulfobacteriota bacterium]